MTIFLLSLFVLLAASAAAGSSPPEPPTAQEDAAALDRFKRYLQIPSVHPNPDYSATTDFLLAIAGELGLASRVLEFVPGKPVLLFTWQGSDPSLPSLLLNSHVDVVPAEPSKWSSPPFAAAEDSRGNVLARGSQDMKCVGLQYLEAIRRLKRAGFKPPRSVHVSFLPDEEIGGNDGAGQFTGSKEFQDLNVGLALDEGLASEGDEYRVFYAERSPWWLAVKAMGRPGHGSKLFDNSAMENLGKSLEIVSKFRAAQFDLVKAGIAAEGEVVSVNPVFLKAGTPTPTGFVMNLQPSEAEAGFDVRMPPFADPVAMEKRIAEEWAPASRNMTYEFRLVQFKQKTPVKRRDGSLNYTPVDDSNPWWSVFKEAISKSNQRLAKPEVFPAATDARYFRDLGIPAFGFSPMANTPILLHDHNEFLSSREYFKGIEVYQILLNSLASFVGSKDDTTSHSEL
ncbi:hypothetical protein SELMODRAFT_406809 [Selaginella moellendorffii]|uniref:N-acyl-aliphatic-L-amino acid amidohydrolase n=1 Tax=Selaginella moellendorffii TaxID=88036 RepID=D8R304_SELML|nr:aminoacylase-1 isoform X1 [Selaginella moellendorffii]EFJ33193.1 hypothetical protein SELMODRAFT_406809 [Selaginella moellendorffii]|eukprot:XP_002965773.1 aminoacylase-1 isoform X1 [Selaginella moellendorffii]